MKTISVRELRHRWPEAEKALRSEREIIITRDSKPIAKLTKWDGEPSRSRRFIPGIHRKWQTQVFGADKTVKIVDHWLDREREDRQGL